MPPEKSTIRKKLLKIRQTLNEQKKYSIDSSLTTQISNLKLIKPNLNILIFYPIKNEPNLFNFFIQLQNSLNLKLFLPKLIEQKNYPSQYSIQPCFFKAESDLISGTYKIKEPKFNNFPNQNLDLIFLTGISFNQNLHRIGYGKGYYDKFLKQFHQNSKPKTIGIFYEFQKSTFTPSTHDEPLDLIITESNIYSPNHTKND